MKNNIIVLKVLLIAIGLGVLLLSVIGLPWLYASLKQIANYSSLIGFQITGYLFITTIPFYYALLRAFNILDYINKNSQFNEKSISCLDSITRASQVILLIYMLSLIILRVQNVLNVLFYLVGISVILIIIIINAFIGVFRELLVYACEIKEENDLTI